RRQRTTTASHAITISWFVEPRFGRGCETTRIHHLMKQWQVVENPERTSLRCDHQLLLTFLDREIRYRHDRQIQLQRLPPFAVIKRDVHSGFGTRVEQSAFIRILSN